MTYEDYTCGDCRYYHPTEELCTSLFKGKHYTPSHPSCGDDWFELGYFNKRYWVKATPLGISTGYSFYLIDEKKELTDSDGDYLYFKYEDEAEILCDFLNEQEERWNETVLDLNDYPDIDMVEFRDWFDKSFVEPLMEADKKNPLNRFLDKYSVEWYFRVDHDNRQYAIRLELDDWSKHPTDKHTEKIVKEYMKMKELLKSDNPEGKDLDKKDGLIK